MTELLTAAQMRAIERMAIDSGAVTGLELMGRAGRGVVEAIDRRWPAAGADTQRAVVLCGPGNNGGDGFVIARLLDGVGWNVEVYLFGDPDGLPPDAATNCKRWVSRAAISPLDEAPTSADGIDLFVDAVFGTGLTRPLEGAVLQWSQAAAKDPLVAERTVAVDMPSGLCSDSGRILGDAPGAVIRSSLAVSFHAPKLGHYLASGPACCGSVDVADIGLESGPDPAIACSVAPPNPGTLAKAGVGHKYDNGHALILSGPPGQGGAARLAARGALRVGAGLVTVGCPLRAVPEHAAQVNAIMVRAMDGPPGLAELLEDERFNAICLGPGLGLGQVTNDLVMTSLKAKRPTVLDADALSRFQRRPEVLFAALHENVVLTPHSGEFARLFPDLHEKLTGTPEQGPGYSKVDAVREAAERAGCAVLLKGFDTVIAAPDGTCRVHAAVYERSTPWLATAGAGDVLSGMIAGLSARGFAPFDAAVAASWLHVSCARYFGPGLIAEDLPEQLPLVFRELGI